MKAKDVTIRQLINLLKKIDSPCECKLYTRTQERKVNKEDGIVFRYSNYRAWLHFDISMAAIVGCQSWLDANKPGTDAKEYLSKLPKWAMRVEDSPLLIHPTNKEYYLRVMPRETIGSQRNFWKHNKLGRITRNNLQNVCESAATAQTMNPFVYTVIRLDSIRNITIDGKLYRVV